MAAYARAHVMRDGSLEIDATEFANQVTKARLMPATETLTMKTLSPTGTVTDTDNPTWVFELAGIQDNGAGSLGAALRAAAGSDMDVVFQPKNGVGQDVATFTMIGAQIPFGGEIGQFRTFDMTFGVRGEPVFSQSV